MALASTPPSPGNLSSCGSWSSELLSSHALWAHDREWSSGGCCRRRALNPWTPHELTSEAMLVTGTRRSGRRRLRLLVVVAGDTSNATRATAVANIAAFSLVREASATFLAAADDCEQWADVAAAAATLGVAFECEPLPAQLRSAGSWPQVNVRRPRHANGRAAAAAAAAATTTALRPKLPLQLHATRARRQPSIGERFDGVWLPDTDVAFTTDAISAFLVRWACAFEHGPPLVAQPAMYGPVSRTERSQQFWPFNFGREWQPGGRLASLGALALHTAYVEQQAPLIDAPFFDWFAEHVGTRLASLQVEHSTDIGTDQLWCRAAAHYSATVLAARPGHELTGRDVGGSAGARAGATTAAGPVRAGCAVIPVPFRHLGTQRKRSSEFWRGTTAVRERAQQLWPHFWLDAQLLRLYRLSSAHVEESQRLPEDRCMVRLLSSRRLGPSCSYRAPPPSIHA